MKTITLQIAPEVSLGFVEMTPGRYRAEHPITNEEFSSLREYANAHIGYIHWGEDSFEIIEKANDFYPIMTFGTANTILQSIGIFFLEKSTKGKCLFPKTGEIVDEIYSHWLESDAEEIGCLSKAALQIDDEKQKQIVRAIAKDINDDTRVNKQLLWLVYELPEEVLQ